MVTSTHPTPATLPFLLLPDEMSASYLGAFHSFPLFWDAIPFLASFLGPGLSKVISLRTCLKQVLSPGYQPSVKDGD